MAVKLIQKVKAKAKKKAAVDEAVVLAVEEMASLKPDIEAGEIAKKKYEKQRLFLRNLVPSSAPPLEPYQFEGETHKAVFGPLQNTRSVTNIKAIHKLLGDEVFYQIVSVSLKDLDSYLTPEEQKGVIKSGLGEVRVCKIEALED